MGTMEKLQDITIRKAKSEATDYKLMDGGGLFVLVKSTGSKLWRFNYRFGGKHKTLALGSYPDVSLADARERHQAARKLIAAKVDPSAERKAQAKASAAQSENTLQAITEEWLVTKHQPNVSPERHYDTSRLLELNILGEIGQRPIAEITPPDLLAVLRKIEARGVVYTAHRAHQTCGQIWRYAIATGKAERDITADLRGALKPHKEKHHAAITDPARLGDLLRSIDGYQGRTPYTKAALQLALMFFVRPGELRQAKWADIDLDAGIWAYHVGKTDTDHIVPLPRQAIGILETLLPLSGHLDFVFPGVRSKDQPMSENTVTAALRYLGYSGDEVTGHGFRATARTILDEVLEYPPHVVEQQLAHAVKDPNGRAYNRTKHLEQRKEMMQRWADYLDELRTGAKVLPFKKEA